MRPHRQLIRAALVAAALTGTLSAWADCVLPPPPSKVPDGNAATEQEMATAMQTLKQYDGDVNVYLKCLEFEERQNRLPGVLRTARHNDAVSALEKVAAKFNEQVRLFKAKHG